MEFLARPPRRGHLDPDECPASEPERAPRASVALTEREGYKVAVVARAEVSPAVGRELRPRRLRTGYRASRRVRGLGRCAQIRVPVGAAEEPGLRIGAGAERGERAVRVLVEQLDAVVAESPAEV